MSRARPKARVTAAAARKFHDSLTVVDGMQYSNFFGAGHLDALAFNPDLRLLRNWRDGGIDCVHVSVSLWEEARATLDTIGRWRRVFREHGDLVMQARSVEDIRVAKAAGKTAVVLGFQNSSPFEDDLALVEIFHDLGVRFAQLTYNIQNFVGGSCYEPADSGLSRFGRYVIGEMNRLGMIVDLSHVGERTSLDAVAASSRPCAITHANPLFAFAHPRNKSERMLRALARRGGVLGLATYPSLTGKAGRSLERWCDMVARTVDLIGVRHVAIGSDTALNWTTEDAMAMNMARWSHTPDYGAHSAKAPGWAPMPAWYRSPADFPNLTLGLLRKGFARDEVALILGGNWMRLFAEGFEPA